MSFIIQHKKGLHDKWRTIATGYHSAATAEAAIRSWDQDGELNTRAFRIIEDTRKYLA